MVYDLMTSPRGLEEQTLLESLGVKRRALQKYVSQLNELFGVHATRAAPSKLVWVKEGGSRRLRFELSDGLTPDRSGWRGILGIALARKLVEAADRANVLSPDIVRVEASERAKIDHGAYWLREVTSNLDRKVWIAPRPSRAVAPGSEEDRGRVLTGLLEQRPLTFSYAAPGRAPRDVTIHPYTLLEDDGTLYVIGSGPGERRPKTYALHRMSQVRVSPPRDRFPYPDPARYDPSRHVEGSFGVFTEDRLPQPVRVVFAPPDWLRALLKESHLHDTARVEDLEGGRLELTLRPRSLVGVGRWLFGLREWVVDVSPEPAAFRPGTPRDSRARDATDADEA